MPLDDLTKDQLQQTLHDVLAVMVQEHQIIAGEINRTQQLLADAVINFSSGFKQLQQLNVEQIQMLQKLAKTSAIDHTGIDAEQYTTKLVQLEQTSLNANIQCTRAMQFEDLTRQSLNSLDGNIAHLAQVVKQLQKIADCSRQELSANFEQLTQLCQTIYLQTQRQNSRRSVEQQTIDEGEIDLF